MNRKEVTSRCIFFPVLLLLLVEPDWLGIYQTCHKRVNVCIHLYICIYIYIKIKDIELKTIYNILTNPFSFFFFFYNKTKKSSVGSRSPTFPSWFRNPSRCPGTASERLIKTHSIWLERTPSSLDSAAEQQQKVQRVSRRAKTLPHLDGGWTWQLPSRKTFQAGRNCFWEEAATFARYSASLLPYFPCIKAAVLSIQQVAAPSDTDSDCLLCLFFSIKTLQAAGSFTINVFCPV